MYAKFWVHISSYAQIFPFCVKENKNPNGIIITIFKTILLAAQKNFFTDTIKQYHFLKKNKSMIKELTLWQEMIK